MISIYNELGESGCRIGILVMENARSEGSDPLLREKESVQKELRETYGNVSRAELKAFHPMDAYVAYYKMFGYTFHVLPQLESVARGKAIPYAPAPVAAMFMAELKNMMLTAGHDLDKVREPLRFLIATGQEEYATLSGGTTTVVPGDVMIRDGEAVLSSILRGPDRRTAVTEVTSRVLYTVYAPPGVGGELVTRHLNDIEAFVRSYAKSSETGIKRVF